MNKHLVGVQGDLIRVGAITNPMSKADALNLAAWLVALADHSKDHADFKTLLEEVEYS